MAASPARIGQQWKPLGDFRGVKNDDYSIGKYSIGYCVIGVKIDIGVRVPIEGGVHGTGAT